MFKTILVPVDVSQPDEAQRVLARAKALTTGWDCTLHVATIVPDMGMAIVGSYFDEGFEAESLKRAAAELDAAVSAAGIAAETHVLSGRIYDRVLDLSESLGADLILLSAHSPELTDYLLGSNAARIVRHAKISVLVLRD